MDTIHYAFYWPDSPFRSLKLDNHNPKKFRVLKIRVKKAGKVPLNSVKVKIIISANQIGLIECEIVGSYIVVKSNKTKGCQKAR